MTAGRKLLRYEVRWTLGEGPHATSNLITFEPYEEASAWAQCWVKREAGNDAHLFAIYAKPRENWKERALKWQHRAEAVVEAARAYSDAVDQGFASKVRPDIARAAMNLAIEAYDRAKGGEQ